jgi:hypothetical protein
VETCMMRVSRFESSRQYSLDSASAKEVVALPALAFTTV